MSSWKDLHGLIPGARAAPTATLLLLDVVVGLGFVRPLLDLPSRLLSTNTQVIRCPAGHASFHLEVYVAHDVAEQRIAPAVAAGGTVVNDSEAPFLTVIADQDGNRGVVCVAESPATDAGHDTDN